MTNSRCRGRTDPDFTPNDSSQSEGLLPHCLESESQLFSFWCLTPQAFVWYKPRSHY
jgi:hypothetical protein